MLFRSTSLVADFDGLVDMTTFLDTGDIFLKIKNRYLIFDNTGEFIDEVEFTDIKESEEEELKHKQAALEEQAKNQWIKVENIVD